MASKYRGTKGLVTSYPSHLLGLDEELLQAKGGNSLQKGKMACKIFYLSLTLHFLSETIRNIMITETVEV